MEQQPTHEEIMMAVLIGKYLTPMVVTVFGGIIMLWIKNIHAEIKAGEKRKEKQLRLIEINIEAMIHAMGKVNSGIGDVFSAEFMKKKIQLVKDDQFVEEHTHE